MEIGEKTRVFYRVLPGKAGFKNRKQGFLWGKNTILGGFCIGFSGVLKGNGGFFEAKNTFLE